MFLRALTGAGVHPELVNGSLQAPVLVPPLNSTASGIWRAYEENLARVKDELADVFLRCPTVAVNVSDADASALPPRPSLACLQRRLRIRAKDLLLPAGTTVEKESTAFELPRLDTLLDTLTRGGPERDATVTATAGLESEDADAREARLGGTGELTTDVLNDDAREENASEHAPEVREDRAAKAPERKTPKGFEVRRQRP